MNMDAVQHLKDIQVDFQSFFGGQWHKNKIWTGYALTLSKVFEVYKVNILVFV